MKKWHTQLETPAQAEKPPMTLAESSPFHPVRRPVYPRLTILDDGSDDQGETIRIRSDSLTIGRIDCDLSFPAESLMSAKHAKISLIQSATSKWCWTIEDLGSRHGVYLRLPEFPLYPGNQFLVGGTKLLVHGDAAIAQDLSAPLSTYEPYVAASQSVRKGPELEVRAYIFSQEPATLPLHGKKMSLGRSACGETAFACDPFVEPVHALLARKEPHVWTVRDNHSLNGIWLRVTRAIIADALQIQLGEQRFCIAFNNSNSH